MLVGDRYLINEVAREFEARGYGGPEALLRCLRDGHLTAHIIFPSFLEQTTPVPPDAWREVVDEEIAPLEHTRRPRPKPFRILPQFAEGAEARDLSSIALASLHRDLARIDEKYIDTLKAARLISQDMDELQWERLIKRFSCWRGKLAAEAAVKHDVYVTRQAWKEFCRLEGFEDAPEAARPGRKPAECWDQIYRQALVLLLSGTQINSLKHFGDILQRWAENETDIAKNAVPKSDTIQRRLKQIEDAVGRRFGSSE